VRRRSGIAVAAFLTLFGMLPGTPAGAVKRPAIAVAQTLSLGAVPATTSAASPDAGEAGSFCSSVTRAELDRPDLHEGKLVHVIYMIPSGKTDEQLDTNGTLACSALAQNEWMRAQSELEWRWDTAIVDTASLADPNSRVETLDVTFIRSTQPAAALDSAGEVQTELILRGFDLDDKRYLTYVASGNDSGICGDAFYPFTHHFEQADGQFAQVYLDSAEGCGARDFGTPATGGGLSEAIAQQELMHNDGMTPLGAPHTCTNAVLPFAHVCTGPLFVLPEVDPEGRDVMFPYVWYPLRDKFLDRGNDDYFDHGLPLAALETSPYLQPANAWGKPFVQPRNGEGPEPQPSATSTPDPAPGLGDRSIDASAGNRRVARGGKVGIHGRISGDDGCVARQRVTLHRRDLSSDEDLAPLGATTDSKGSFSFRVRVRRPTRFVAVASETDSCVAARSAPFVVRPAR
jgi:hypothetical protein